MYVQVYTIYKFVHEETRCDEPHNKNFNLYRHSSKSSTIYSWADTIICNNRNYHFSMILHHSCSCQSCSCHSCSCHSCSCHSCSCQSCSCHSCSCHSCSCHSCSCRSYSCHSCSCHSCATVVHATVVYVCACDTESTYDYNTVLTSTREILNNMASKCWMASLNFALITEMGCCLPVGKHSDGLLLLQTMQK